MILEPEDFGATHALCEAVYEMRPLTAGTTFRPGRTVASTPSRSAMTAVHSSSTGDLIAYDLNVDAATRDTIAATVDLDGHVLAAPIRPEAPNRPHRPATSACGDVDDHPAVTEFFDRQPAHVRDGAGGRCGRRMHSVLRRRIPIVGLPMPKRSS